METALRDALAKVESQALRHKDKIRSKKRQPKEEKRVDAVPPSRTRSGTGVGNAEQETLAAAPGNGSSRAHTSIPVTVHSFPTRVPITEPHVVRSSDSVALRPMTLEEAVKEAEFRDREVFVFRDNEGNVKVLHRKRDGKMEVIDAP
jgi:putative sigma-54 modulation protein